MDKEVTFCCRELTPLNAITDVALAYEPLSLKAKPPVKKRSSIGIELLDEYCELAAVILGLKKRKGGIYDAT